MVAGQRHSGGFDELPPSMAAFTVSDFFQFLNSEPSSSKLTLLNMHHSKVFCVPCKSCSQLPKDMSRTFVILCRHNMQQKNIKLDQRLPLHEQAQEEESMEVNSPKIPLSKKEEADDVKIEESDTDKTKHSKARNFNKRSNDSIGAVDGKRHKVATKSLSMNAPTLKQTARLDGMASWHYCSTQTRTKIHNQRLPDSMESAVRRPERTTDDLTIKCAKIKFRNNVIKIEISTLSKMVDLEEKIAVRLKLEIGSFRIKYMDEDQDLIMITCDADLSCCMRTSETTLIRMVVNLDPSEDCINSG